MKIRVLDSSGDSVLDVKPDVPASLAEAKELFERLMNEGRSAFPAQGGSRVKSFEDLMKETDVVVIPRIEAG